MKKNELTVLQAFEMFYTDRIMKGLATASLIDYKNSWGHFKLNSGIKDDDPISIISKYVWQDYVLGMQQSNLKVNSINHYIRAVRAFLNYCFSENLISKFKISIIKGQEENIKFYTETEIDKLLKINKKSASFVEYRSYAIICFILATGARANTVCNIKTEDIDFSSGTVYLTTLKNKKVQSIPLSISLSRVLQEYIRVWDFSSEFLFPNVSDSQLTKEALRLSLEDYFTAHGVKYHGVHGLRHTFARQYILNGGNAFQLQRLLGHSTLEMTKKYVRLFAEDMKKDFEEFSPLDNLIRKDRIKRK